MRRRELMLHRGSPAAVLLSSRLRGIELRLKLGNARVQLGLAALEALDLFLARCLCISERCQLLLEVGGALPGWA